MSVPYDATYPRLCPFCPTIVKNRYMMAQHTDTFHEVQTRNWVKCYLCPKRAESKVALAAHMAVHKEVRSRFYQVGDNKMSALHYVKTKPRSMYHEHFLVVQLSHHNGPKVSAVHAVTYNLSWDKHRNNNVVNSPNFKFLEIIYKYLSSRPLAYLL